MNKRLRSMGMIIALVVMLLYSTAMPRTLHASDAKAEETVVHVQWSGNEQEWDQFLAELKGMDYQVYKDGAKSPFAETPISQNWTSKEMSAQALAAWVQQPPADMAARYWNVTITGRIWLTNTRYIEIEVTIRICEE